MNACPSCGKDKADSKPLCPACFYTLPVDSRLFLYASDPARRAASVTAAIDWLAGHRHWKAERTKRNVYQNR